MRRAAYADELVDDRPSPSGPRCSRSSAAEPHQARALLKSQIPIRTWSEWDEAAPGFVEIDLVGHEGGNSLGEFCFTLTVTDVATGWTVNRSVRTRPRSGCPRRWSMCAAVFPFPILGIDSDNGSEFINAHFYEWCTSRQDHLHPLTAGQQERRLPRRAEELDPCPRARRLPAL